MSLATLPVEIYLAIAQSLCQPDLSALARASRHLRTAVQPLLYTDIEIKWAYQCEPPRIMHLLRTLLENHDLAKNVLSLKLRGRGFYDEYSDRLPPGTLPDVTELPIDGLSAAVDASGIPLHNDTDCVTDWTAKIQAGQPDATVSLLVSILPSLTHLHLSTNWTVETRFLGMLFRANAPCAQGLSHGGLPSSDPQSHQLRLQNLEHVVMVDRCAEQYAEEGHEEEDDAVGSREKNTADVLSLFYLPSIRRMSVSIDSPLQFLWPFENSPSQSNVTTLELERIRENRLESLLSPLKSLRYLRYNCFHQTNIDPAVSGTALRLDTMASAFSKCRQTLTGLEINIDTEQSGDEIDHPYFIMTGELDLSGLHNLTRLEVPWQLLAGRLQPAPEKPLAALLPRSLEYIGFSSGTHAFILWGQEQGWDGESLLQVMGTELERRQTGSLRALQGICLPRYDYRENHPKLLELEVLMEDLAKRFNITMRRRQDADHSPWSFATFGPRLCLDGEEDLVW